MLADAIIDVISERSQNNTTRGLQPCGARGCSDSNPMAFGGESVRSQSDMLCGMTCVRLCTDGSSFSSAEMKRVADGQAVVGQSLFS